MRTLICSLLVAAVCLALAACKSKRVRTKETKLHVVRVLDGIQEWRADNSTKSTGEGNCPKSLDELVPSHFKSKETKDGWGNKLKFSCVGERVCVWSSGANKKDEKGGGDDIRACTEEGEDR